MSHEHEHRRCRLAVDGGVLLLSIHAPFSTGRHDAAVVRSLRAQCPRCGLDGRHVLLRIFTVQSDRRCRHGSAGTSEGDPSWGRCGRHRSAAVWNRKSTGRERGQVLARRRRRFRAGRSGFDCQRQFPCIPCRHVDRRHPDVWHGGRIGGAICRRPDDCWGLGLEPFLGGDGHRWIGHQCSLGGFSPTTGASGSKRLAEERIRSAGGRLQKPAVHPLRHDRGVAFHSHHDLRHDLGRALPSGGTRL